MSILKDLRADRRETFCQWLANVLVYVLTIIASILEFPLLLLWFSSNIFLFSGRNKESWDSGVGARCTPSRRFFYCVFIFSEQKKCCSHLIICEGGFMKFPYPSLIVTQKGNPNARCCSLEVIKRQCHLTFNIKTRNKWINVWANSPFVWLLATIIIMHLQ